jgi:membrane-associated phospholipid phosphatase
LGYSAYNNSVTRHSKKKLIAIFRAFYAMIIGLLLFKYIPMAMFGSNILFDASAHITFVSFVLYIIWYFVDQNKSWRLPYFTFVFLVLAIVSFQRIYENAHNDLGLLSGLILSLAAVIYSRQDYFKDKFSF